MASAFTVLPMSQEVFLKAGEKYGGVITVANPADSTESFEYTVRVMPYSVVDENYRADFATKSNQTQITDWITIEDQTGKLEPNELKKVHFVIDVPTDAPAGGQYAVLAVAASNNDNVKEAVNNVFEMASVIYASVEGETVHEGQIVSSSVPGFSTNTPITSSVMLTNEGNVHEVATTTITVKDVFRGQIFPVDGEENQFVEYIMPKSSRYLTRSIDRMAGLGIYEVEQTVEYLGGSASLTQVVIVCPIWFMILVLVTLAVGISVVIGMVKKHLRRKREVE